MSRQRHTRRRVLVAGSSMTLIALAGCTGSDDDSESDDPGGGSSAGNGIDDETTADDGDSEGDTGGESDVWTIAPPNDPAFLANPDVEGPGEDAGYVLATTIRNHGSIDEYDRFEVDLESVVLHDGDGTDVTVPVDVTVDFTAYDSGPAGDVITLTWLHSEIGIPAGTYTSLSLETSAVELVHHDEGDVTDSFEGPPTAEFSSDDGTDVAEQSALRTELNLEVGSATFEQSLGVGTATGDVLVFDPEYYENE